jgi:hypothetical protein
MSEETQATEEVRPREVLVDDVAYAVNELPEQVQRLIATYDVWVADRAEAQKTFAQMDSACRHLAGQIQAQIREMAAADAAVEESGPVADDAPAAALDIPADDE